MTDPSAAQPRVVKTRIGVPPELVESRSAATTTLPESEEDVRQALSNIAHLVRYEWRLRDHDIGLVLRTIEQVLDQYGIGVPS